MIVTLESLLGELAEARQSFVEAMARVSIHGMVRNENPPSLQDASNRVTKAWEALRNRILEITEPSDVEPEIAGLLEETNTTFITVFDDFGGHGRPG